MDLVEGVGESSSPVRSSSIGGGGFGGFDIRTDVYNRLIENGNEEAVNNPNFRDDLDAHFNRLPARYGLDVNMDRVEDVLLHQKLLTEAKVPENRPVFFVRFIENLQIKPDGNDGLGQCARAPTSRACFDAEVEGNIYRTLISRNVDNGGDPEPWSKLGDLNLDVGKIAADTVNSGGHEVQHVPIHEIIFSTVDKPKLLSQLSALLSDIDLNIREAHVFSTIDGFSLDVFVVDGWPIEDTEGLWEAVGKAVLRAEGSWSGSSSSNSVIEKALAAQLKPGDWEIDGKLLKMGDKIASGSCGDLYQGVYLGNDIAIKVLRSEHLNEDLGIEFAQEVKILSKVEHRNVVRFIGASTKQPRLCIITEFMPGGSLYDYLHKHRNILELPLLLKFAIDVCKGMEYLHQNNIIHRDLKTANLLMDTENVVKVADFGVARFQHQGGEMTAETGTYRWMAPEVINHEPYDQKADVFSFAIVLWELTTSKVPYDTLTPLQAALGVRQGLRPHLPDNIHPRILNLMQRCWDAVPSNRPPFSEIALELEQFLQEEVQEKPLSRYTSPCANCNGSESLPC